MRCALRAYQIVQVGRRTQTSLVSEEVLIDIHRRSNVRRERRFVGPERRQLSPIYAELDGTQSIKVRVAISFDIWRDASGVFIFDGIEPDDRFRINVPPWSVEPLVHFG